MIFREIIKILPRSYRVRGATIILWLILSSLFDLFSLASFLPLIILAIDPQQITENAYFSKVHNLIGVEDPIYFSLYLVLFVIFLVALKAFFNTWIAYKKASYGYEVANELSSNAVTKYLYSSYEHFSDSDNAEQINQIVNLPLIFSNNVLIPAGTVLSESFILSILLLSIAVYDPTVFLFILLIILPVSLIYWYNKSKVKEISQRIKATYPIMLRNALQIIDGFAEIKTFQKENFFRKKLHDSFQSLGMTFSRDHAAQTTASRITEFVAATCIGALIIYVIIANKSPRESILLLSIYAGACLRAIPSINRVLTLSTQMKAYEFTLHDLIKIASFKRDHSNDATTPVRFEHSLELKGIFFKHKGLSWILENASLTVSKGDRIVLLGKSGSGKTTLFLIIMRFLKEQKGDILIDGKPLVDSSTTSFRKLIGYVPQNPYIVSGSLVENIAFGVPGESVDIEKIVHILKYLNLYSWVSSLPDKLDTKLGEKGVKISGGQRQRISIARALYFDAEIMLLDEITSQLDKQTEIEIKETIDSLALQRKTVILITHRPELWKSFDRVYEITGGKFVEIPKRNLSSALHK